MQAVAQTTSIALPARQFAGAKRTFRAQKVRGPFSGAAMGLQYAGVSLKIASRVCIVGGNQGFASRSALLTRLLTRRVCCGSP